MYWRSLGYYTLNDYTQNYLFYSLQLVVEMFGHRNLNSMKVPKVVEAMNKKKLIKTLGTSVTQTAQDGFNPFYFYKRKSFYGFTFKLFFCFPYNFEYSSPRC